MNTDKIFQFFPSGIRDKIRKLRAYYNKPALLRLYSGFISKGDLVFDVGANVGDYTEIFLDLGATVVAIEPQPVCIDILKKRFSQNPDVILITKGLSNEETTRQFFVSTKNHATSTFSEKFKTEGPFNNRKWDKQLDIQTTTLDALIRDYGLPRFCKIDVEGYEYEVLDGLHAAIPAISFEYSLKLLEETERCVRHLSSLGPMEYNYMDAATTVYGKLNKGLWTSDYRKILEILRRQSRAGTGDIYARSAQTGLHA
ncbi:MAG TPA: FkbM family methyltransferase [Acidobacteriota bacterium]|nr:FkbM family methyltransferase [Acidobacteriota bacterium]